MSNKVYILQKDYLAVISKKPVTIKSGSEFIETGEFYTLNGEGWMLPKECVENNPDWFLPKEEEKMHVTGFGWHILDGKDNRYHFNINQVIPLEKYEAITKAVEFVLNDKSFVEKANLEKEQKLRADILKLFCGPLPEWKYSDKRVIGEEKKYTEKDLLDAREHAFNASRDKAWVFTTKGMRTALYYNSFSEYMDDISKLPNDKA